MSMTVGEAEAAMKVVRHVMDAAKADTLDSAVLSSLVTLHERAHRTLMAGVSETEMERWLAGGR
jgi:hypothetical protein